MKPRPRLSVLAGIGLTAALLAGLVLYGIVNSTVHEAANSEGNPTGTVAPIFKYLKSMDNMPDAPSITFADRAKMPVTLADFGGRWIVLNLWATWCGPCVTELPRLAKLQAALPQDKFVVLAVDLENLEPDKVHDFLMMHKADALSVYVDRKLTLMRAFTAYALPLTVIIDPMGREVASAVGPETWDDPAVIAYLKGLSGS